MSRPHIGVVMKRPHHPHLPPTVSYTTAVSARRCTGDGYFNPHDRETIMRRKTNAKARSMHPEVHIRKHPDDATAKPVWCGATGVASITEAWGYYGPGGDGHAEVCRGCIDKQRRARRIAS